MRNLKRYSATTDIYGRARMEEDSGGEYVDADNAEAEIERLRALLQEISKLLKDAPPVCDNIYSRGDQSYGAQVKAMRARIDAELAKGQKEQSK